MKITAIIYHLLMIGIVITYPTGEVSFHFVAFALGALAFYSFMELVRWWKL